MRVAISLWRRLAKTDSLDNPLRKGADMRFSGTLMALGAVIAAIGCSGAQKLAPAPAALPQSLGTWLASGGLLGLPAVGSCAQQFTNPGGDGTVLVQRSTERTTSTTKMMNTTSTGLQVTADYEIVPAGRYGVSAANLVRVDCATLQVLGLAPKD